GKIFFTAFAACLAQGYTAESAAGHEKIMINRLRSGDCGIQRISCKSVSFFKTFMFHSMPYADIIILALISGFILLRLLSGLGQKMGSQPPAAKPLADNSRNDRDKIVQVAEKQQRQKQKEKEEEQALLATITDNAVSTGLENIRRADATFSAKHFL